MKFDLAQSIRADIKSERIELSYQPVLCYDKKQVYCLEALFNWYKLKEFDISNEEFFDYVERSPELMLAIDHYVLQRAFKDMLKFRASSDFSGFVSINISPSTLANSATVKLIEKLITQADLVSSPHLILEITERRRWEEPEKVDQNLQHLHSLGVKIAVDDFISGYSNFASLINTQVSIIKIDRSLTQELLTNPMVRKFFQSFLPLAVKLNKSVVIEGVERVEEAILLHSEGYNLFQGFYFSRPGSVTDITNYLNAPLLYDF